LGVTGWSIASMVAQTLALAPLLLRLYKNIPATSMFQDGLSAFSNYISHYSKAGFLLVGRSIARIAAFSYCSRQSVRNLYPLKSSVSNTSRFL
jgi:Na+-driven multidrug efflux pump